MKSGEIFLRPAKGDWEDGVLISRWRNSPDSRIGFFNQDVLTPDTHIEFMKKRPMHRLVWIAEKKIAGEQTPVASAALQVDVKKRQGELISVLVAPEFRGQGVGRELDRAVLDFAFRVLWLENVWGVCIESNHQVIEMHRSVGFTVSSPFPLEGKDCVKISYMRSQWQNGL